MEAQEARVSFGAPGFESIKKGKRVRLKEKRHTHTHTHTHTHAHKLTSTIAHERPEANEKACLGAAICLPLSKSFQMRERIFAKLPFSAGPVAQWIRHRPSEPGIAGYSPAGVIAIMGRALPFAC